MSKLMLRRGLINMLQDQWARFITVFPLARGVVRHVKFINGAHGISVPISRDYVALAPPLQR